MYIELVNDEEKKKLEKSNSHKIEIYAPIPKNKIATQQGEVVSGGRSEWARKMEEKS